MSFHSRIVSATLLSAGALISLPAAASCGSAYCSINTDLAAEAAGIIEGSVLDLRYERINQNQPRSGSGKVAVGQIPKHHDEVSTRNGNVLATYSRTFASGWGLSVTAPFSDRDHVHIHNHRGAKFVDEWDYREIGDMRVTGRYQKALTGSDDAPRTAGVIFGLKLPTGRTDVSNAAGDLAERTLQPGSGTTDLILGAFFHQQLPQQGASWFAQAQMQRALREHDNFRPGAQFAVDVGYAKALTDKLSGIVQVNAVVKRRDRGAEAEPQDSGSRSLFLSPGVSYQMTPAVRAYAFYQQPLYQHVNGVQLTADRALVFGMSTSF
jgi:hypothetical protein